jgi:hypothetical protein
MSWLPRCLYSSVYAGRTPLKPGKEWQQLLCPARPNGWPPLTDFAAAAAAAAGGGGYLIAP